MSLQVLMYVPVIHVGYEAFLDEYRHADEVLLIDESFERAFPAMRKEIRALSAPRAAQYLRPRYRTSHIRTVAFGELPNAIWADELVMPDELITRRVASLIDNGKTRVTLIPTFLRWDREWSRAGRPANYDGEVSLRSEDIERLRSLITDRAAHSSDWWRQVGAAIVIEGQVMELASDSELYGLNHHLPTEYAPYVNGDPRNEFSRGDRADLSTAIHAEASVIAIAARYGVILEGADIYVTTFPCPSCAYLIAESGIKRCFFAGGYSVLAGDDVLRAAGVELIFVDIQ